MNLFFWSWGIAGIVYLIIGIVLAVRIHSMHECGKVKEGIDNAGIFWLFVFAWGFMGICSMWKNGVDEL